MAAISRREFIKKAAADAAVAGVLAARASAVHASPLGLPIGSQTYPHRALLKEDFPGLLKQLAQLGVQTIELCSPFGYADFAGLANGAEVKKIIADAGLTCESSHFSMRELRQQQETSLAWAHDVGITQIITATLGVAVDTTIDVVKRVADDYNRIAAVSAKAGMQQGLHNEGFETSTVDGLRTYDVLFTYLDPALVKFQFQMSTISQGFLAEEYFTKYPGRFFSMHVQDVDLDATPPPPPVGEPQRAGRGVQTSVGKGSIDWVRTFQAAKIAGVKNYFVEQNMELTKASVAYLKTLNV